jgi:hypothetical protein
MLFRTKLLVRGQAHASAVSGEVGPLRPAEDVGLANTVVIGTTLEQPPRSSSSRVLTAAPTSATSATSATSTRDVNGRGVSPPRSSSTPDPAGHQRCRCWTSRRAPAAQPVGPPSASRNAGASVHRPRGHACHRNQTHRVTPHPLRRSCLGLQRVVGCVLRSRRCVRSDRVVPAVRVAVSDSRLVGIRRQSIDGRAVQAASGTGPCHGRTEAG